MTASCDSHVISVQISPVQIMLKQWVLWQRTLPTKDGALLRSSNRQQSPPTLWPQALPLHIPTLKPPLVCWGHFLSTFLPLSLPSLLSLPQGLITSHVSSFPPHLRELREKLMAFMKEKVLPLEPILSTHQLSPDRWTPHPKIEELKVCCLAK